MPPYALFSQKAPTFPSCHSYFFKNQLTFTSPAFCALQLCLRCNTIGATIESIYSWYSRSWRAPCCFSLEAYPPPRGNSSATYQRALSQPSALPQPLNIQYRGVRSYLERRAQFCTICRIYIVASFLLVPKTWPVRMDRPHIPTRPVPSPYPI